MRLPSVWDGSAYSRQLHPISCSISLTLQPVSSANMSLPAMDDIKVLDWVAVPIPDGDVMYCRVASVSTDAATGEKSVYMEQGACLFDDVLIRETSSRSPLSMKDTIANILTFIVSNQQRWTVGTVEAADTIYIELGDRTPMAAILEMMQSIPGYQVEFVQADQNDWHVDIRHRPTAPMCEGRLSRNLKSCDIAYSADSICTRVYSDVLTDGHMDSANLSVYGVREQTLSINDGLSAEQRETIARAYLDAHDHPSVSIGISGVELSQVTGLPIDHFQVGKVCRIAIPWLDITADEVIVDKRYSDPYNAPEAVSFTLANATPDLSIAIAAVTGGGGGGGGGVVKELKRYNTKFEQTDEYFRLLATDTQWDELENGTITAYGQLVLTANSFQSVIANIGQDGTITAASIIMAINQGGSQITIEADRIDINGLVTELSTRAIGVGSLLVEGDTNTLGSIYAEDFIHTDETITAAKTISAGTGLYVAGTDVSNMLIDATISGSTLTLTRRDGTTVNFNKAAAIVGSWSGGTYTVSATSGVVNALSTSVSVSGGNTITSNGTYTYKVMYEDGDGNDQETGASKRITVNVPTTSYSNSARFSRYTLSGSATDDRRIYIKKNGSYTPILTQADYAYIIASGTTVPNAQTVYW